MSALIKIADDYGRTDARSDILNFWAEMSPCVVRAVTESFMTSNMRNPSHHEVKRRSDIAKELVEILRRDLHWSKTRIKDHLFLILQSRLAGQQVDLNLLDARHSWME